MSVNQVIPSNKQNLLPTISSNEEAEDYLQNISTFVRLTALQKAYLLVIIRDTVAEKPRTQVEVAKELGCHVRNIAFMHANPAFNTCLGLLMVGITRGETHIYVAQMRKLALNNDFRAIKFMLEYGGTYVKKAQLTTQNLNVTMQQEDTTTESFVEAVDKFLTRMGGRGWTAERIVTRFQQLASEGAW